MINKKILLTGVAGFIGNHLALFLLNQGYEVIGIDNLDNYYDITLKKSRLDRLTGYKNFLNYEKDISDRNAVHDIFKIHKPNYVINLAAQAGVRYSLTNPHKYIDSNIYGFLNILECCRHHNVEHLIYASSSSVYGSNCDLPFSENHKVDNPISLYAASKKSNELMAHTYTHLFGLPTTGLRFFTVYGPWGRPDMAMYLFANAISNGQPIKIFNNGNMKRDFTYIDDIIDGIFRVIKNISSLDLNAVKKSGNIIPYNIYNIGSSNPIDLLSVINLIEKGLGKTAIKDYLPLQPGDVRDTYADISHLVRDTGFVPDTNIELGVHKFIQWYKQYYQISA